MANRLKMAQVHSILTLRAQGWSRRRIARALGIHRETVSRYIALAKGRTVDAIAAAPAEVPKPANAPIGSTAPGAETASSLTAGVPAQATFIAEPEAEGTGPPTGSVAPKPANALIGACHEESFDPACDLVGLIAAQPEGAGPPSRCAPFRDLILAKLERGLSAVRIHQDLTGEHGATISYHSVRRFVRRLTRRQPLPFRRMECGPGEEAQVDFGSGAPIIVPADPKDAHPKPRRRRTHVFRIVLSHSRKAYSEAVFRQTTEDVIRCLENAFHHFGGVPRTVVIDNLKAAVTQADWFDPELNPKIEAFARHYGTAILPTKPAMPRHKGKIERSVGYAKDNGLKDRSFTCLQDQNRHLLEWETSVADRRLHGTIRKQVGPLFEQVEKPALLPLPVERFPCFREARRTVHRDGHVEVDKAYYSVPPEYVGHQVWARWDARTVRIFNHQMTQIALHVRSEPGRFSTQDRHIVSEKISCVERGATWLLERAARIGPQAGRWAEAMLAQRGIEGVRVLSGLISLAKRHPSAGIEQACRIAHTHGSYRLRVIRRLIQHHDAPQEQLAFLERHPIIRNLSEYDAALRDLQREEFVHESIQKAPTRESALPPTARPSTPFDPSNARSQTYA